MVSMALDILKGRLGATPKPEVDLVNPSSSSSCGPEPVGVINPPLFGAL